MLLLSASTKKNIMLKNKCLVQNKNFVHVLPSKILITTLMFHCYILLEFIGLLVIMFEYLKPYLSLGLSSNNIFARDTYAFSLH